MRAVRADAEYLPHPVVIALVASAQAVSQFTRMVSPVGSDLFDNINRKLGNVWTAWARYFEKTHSVCHLLSYEGPLDPRVMGAYPDPPHLGDVSLSGDEFTPFGNARHPGSGPSLDDTLLLLFTRGGFFLFGDMALPARPCPFRVFVPPFVAGKSSLIEYAALETPRRTPLGTRPGATTPVSFIFTTPHNFTWLELRLEIIRQAQAPATHMVPHDD